MSPIATLFGTPRQWATDLVVGAAIGVFLGVIGPFGSFYGGPLEVRVPFWIVNIWIGFAALSFVARGSLQVAERFDLPFWFALAVGVAMGSAPLCLAIAWFSRMFWTGRPITTPLLGWYGQTLAIAEPCTFAYYYVMAFRARGPAVVSSARASIAEPLPATSRVPSAVFLERLPPRLGSDLLCLQMEDHYVRVHTAGGSDLLLTSLKEAISDLQEVDGLQVHRSWWVSRSAVVEIVTKGRNLALRLRNGLEVPVSRASVARLRASGWLGPAESPPPDNPHGAA